MTEFKQYLSSIEEIIENARNGRMFILVDEEDRENEGDLIIPAQMCTPDAVNFMARFGRGLICLALPGQRAEQLNLQLMAQNNASRLRTAFTVSIEAREGVSTGISAHDRARTIAVAIDPTKGAQDIVSPGHVFPLVARDGGTLVRAGHTEAAVDISRLAGLYPAGVICEIMNDDGTMARLPDLVKFAQLHGLKVGTIADLIAYRRRYDHLIERMMEYPFPSAYGGTFKLYIYENTVDKIKHLALVKGDISGPEPVLVRMHAVSIFEDLLGYGPRGRHDLIPRALRQISEEGRGVLVIIRDPAAYIDAITRDPATHPQPGGQLRNYGVGAQILLDLGVSEMILLSNSPKQVIVGLEGYGLTVAGNRPIPPVFDSAEGIP